MKITLDINELADILSRYLNTTITEENIAINIDPVASITVSSVPLSKAPTPTPQKSIATPSEAPFREERKEAAPPTMENTDDFGADTSDHVLTMEDILALNSAATQNRKVLDHPEITRVLGQYETLEPPPMTEAEVRANRR